MKGWKRGLGLLSALGLMMGCGGEAEPEGAPSLRSTEAAAVTEACKPRTVYSEQRMEVTYDTHVAQDAPTTSYGTSTLLVTDGSPRQETYLDFRFGALPGWIQARLELFATDGSTNGPLLHRTSSGWNDSLTWNTRPAPIGAPVGNVGEVASGSRVVYDLTNIVTDDGAHAFVLIPEGGNGLDFVSGNDPREDLRPTLVLTYAETVCTYQGAGGALAGGWVKGGAGNESPQAMASDSSGAQVIAGVYTGAGNLGGSTFPTPGGLMLGRFGADGSHQWSRAFPQANATLTVTSVTLTPLGNVLVVGGYEGTPDFGTGPLPTHPFGMFIAKFSPTGNITWAKGFTARVVHGSDVDLLPIRANAVATDANGSLIVTGYFFGYANLGGGDLYAGPGSTAFEDAAAGMFIAKYSWEGNHLWSQVYTGGYGGTLGRALATDTAGNILLGAEVSRSQTDFVLGATERETPVVAKFSPEGSLLWSRALNGARGSVNAVAALPGDAVAFSGHFKKTFTFAGQTVASSQAEEWDGGNTDVMLGVLEASGTDRWARRYGGDGNDGVRTMKVDAQGHFRVAGSHGPPVDLGGGPIGPTDGRGNQTFVASYGANGAHRWSWTVGPDVFPPLLGITPDGSTFFGGTLRGSAFVGPARYGPSNGTDLLLLKFAP